MHDGGFASGGAIALMVVLGVLLVGAVVGLVIVVRRLQRAERRVEVLEAEIEAAGGDTGEIPALPKSLVRAERAVRTMVDAAFKVRDQGVGGLLMESMDNLSRWAIEDRGEITEDGGQRRHRDGVLLRHRGLDRAQRGAGRRGLGAAADRPRHPRAGRRSSGATATS